MVYLKRSTKQRNILKKYTLLSPIVDVCTRWNSTLHMIRRFIQIFRDLKKAALDSKEINEKMVFSDNDFAAIVQMVKILTPFEIATNKLSERGTNLHMADIILESLVFQIDDPDLRSKTVDRIEQRRTFLSDILLFLRGDTENIFYNVPSDKSIIETYQKVIF